MTEDHPQEELNSEQCDSFGCGGVIGNRLSNPR
jgi:hypothetical protein